MSEFKVGDKIECIDAEGYTLIKKGSIYTIFDFVYRLDGLVFLLREIPDGGYYYSHLFKLVEEKESDFKYEFNALKYHKNKQKQIDLEINETPKNCSRNFDWKKDGWYKTKSGVKVKYYHKAGIFNCRTEFNINYSVNKEGCLGEDDDKYDLLDFIRPLEKDEWGFDYVNNQQNKDEEDEKKYIEVKEKDVDKGCKISKIQEQIDIMKSYAKMSLDRCDWHALWDAAIDLAKLSDRLEVLNEKIS